MCHSIPPYIFHFQNFKVVVGDGGGWVNFHMWGDQFVKSFFFVFCDGYFDGGISRKG